MRCTKCGRDYEVEYRTTKAYREHRKFCSPECYQASKRGAPQVGGKKRTPPESRFWGKVLIAAPTRCWLWQGAKNLDGYGVLLVTKNPRRMIGAHRVSWKIHNGEVPPGMHVLHHCDTPACVNPGHLFLGDQVVNNLDRDRKGRGGNRRGERNGRTQVTDAQVAEIRARYAKGNVTQAALGAEYGISEVQVWRIVHHHQR